MCVSRHACHGFCKGVQALAVDVGGGLAYALGRITSEPAWAQELMAGYWKHEA